MDSSSSSSSTCPICLENFKNQSYLDLCYHSFCYTCITKWSQRSISKSSPKSIFCPLCKVESFSIIHSFNGTSFIRDYIDQLHETSCSFLSVPHRFRLQWYGYDSSEVVGLFDVEKYWRSFGFVKKKNVWIQRWLTREIQALLQEQDVDVIMHHIHGVVEFFMKKQLELRRSGNKLSPEESRKEFQQLLADAAAPFLHEWTERFITELEMFLACGLNIEAYDEVCMNSLKSSTDQENESDHCE